MTKPTRKILLSGASGLVGSTLVRAFSQDRISTIQLIRKKNLPGAETVIWDPDAAQPVNELERLEGIDAAIHLSGANLAARRWTESYKREIVNSRVDSTRALVRVFEALKQPPRVLLCASATGIYGDRGDEILTEDSSVGQDFITDTCVAWEAAAGTAKSLGMRVVYLRFGVVLTAQAGALQRMLPVFRLGAGGRLGSGRQWMNWIALPDMVSAIQFLLEAETLEGPVNLATPNPVTNAEFAAALGHAVHRPAILPVPAFALRLAFGEIAHVVLLCSTRAVPKKLMDAGFTFKYPDIASALQAVL